MMKACSKCKKEKNDDGFKSINHRVCKLCILNNKLSRIRSKRKKDLIYISDDEHTEDEAFTNFNNKVIKLQKKNKRLKADTKMLIKISDKNYKHTEEYEEYIRLIIIKVNRKLRENRKIIRDNIYI